jgi:hypothetical protein
VWTCAYLCESRSHFFDLPACCAVRVTPLSQTHYYNLVKYTKTLLVRNQHGNYSTLFCSIRPPAAAPDALRRRRSRRRDARSPRHRRGFSRRRARRKKTPRQSAPIAAWVYAIASASARAAALIAARCPTRHTPRPSLLCSVFKFVAIMRHGEGIGKRIAAAVRADGA